MSNKYSATILENTNYINQLFVFSTIANLGYKMRLDKRRDTESLLGISNIVTFARMLFVFFAIYFFLSNNNNSKLTALILIVITFSLDYIDGMVARKFNSATYLGSIMDIAVDRIVENGLWITFAYIKLIPLWIPLVVISRGFITDSFRSYAALKGKSAFGKKTMMIGKIGIFFVSSRFSRTSYAVAKAITFSLLALQMYLANINYLNIEMLKEYQ